MDGAYRDQASSLLAVAKNHSDLAVKLSSLKQAKDILLFVEPSLAVEFFPYLVELHTSPESLVRKFLLDLMEELGLKVMEHSSMLMPVLLAFLKDDASIVVRQCIACGTKFFCGILEEMALQFHQFGKVERWLEELWTWMVKFKDAVYGITLEPGPVGTILLAVKFMETYVLLFTPDSVELEKFIKEGRTGQSFNISLLVGDHPALDSALLTVEANRSLGLLLDLLQSANTLRGSLMITVINCLASIARKRPVHYTSILAALLGFDPNFEMPNGGHAASIQHSLRTAFLGFLRSTHPCIIESRDRLLRTLRSMNAGDAADQVIRRVDKMIKNIERASRDARFSREDQSSTRLSLSGDIIEKRHELQDNEAPTYLDELPAKRALCGDSVLDDSAVNGISLKTPLLDRDLTPVDQLIAMIGVLLADGERGAESLEILISKIHPDMLADVVIANMKHLSKNPPPLANRVVSTPINLHTCSSTPPQVVISSSPSVSVQSHVLASQVSSPFSSAITVSTSSTDISTVPNILSDNNRDPRRVY